jgi:tetratricopeptide (TPR) repeat protein
MTMRVKAGERAKLRIGVVGAALCLLAAAGCSRSNIEAVNLSNEADKSRGGNLDDAISKYEQATTLDPTNHRILWKLATAYQKKEAWDKVSITLSKAQKLAPTYANYFFLDGYAKEQLAIKGPASWADAKEPLLQAVKLDPNLADPNFELGEILLHLDDEQGALQNYTEAVNKKPDELPFYGPLAELYIRLGYYDLAEQVLKEAINYKKEGDKAAFVIYSLLGQTKEIKGDAAGAIADFESAKKACGQCNEKGQQIAFFNLGAAYSKASPPRKNEAIQQLAAFQKTVCKGGAAAKYADECSQAQEIVKQLGGTL